MADLRRLPEGTLPPVVMKVDASSFRLPAHSRWPGTQRNSTSDYLQFQIRNQIAASRAPRSRRPTAGNIADYGLRRSAETPSARTQSHGCSSRDERSNLILPAGDVRLGPLDYTSTPTHRCRRRCLEPGALKTEGQKSVFLSDVGKAVDGSYQQ